MTEEKHLGDMPWLTRKGLHDYPRVIINGTRYRDVTNAFFEDGKYRKEYITTAEAKRRARQEVKRIIGNLDLRNPENNPGRIKTSLTGQQKEEIIKLYYECYSYWSIAKITKISLNKVTDLLKELRASGKIRRSGKIVESELISTKQSKRYTKAEESTLMEMYKNGNDYGKIGEKLNRSAWAIESKIKRMKYEGKW